MIKELDEKKVLPRSIKIYLDTIRIIGNIAAHEENGVNSEDLVVILPLLIHITKWLILHSLELIITRIKQNSQ
jgi:hypothetical protein